MNYEKLQQRIESEIDQEVQRRLKSYKIDHSPRIRRGRLIIEVGVYNPDISDAELLTRNLSLTALLNEIFERSEDDEYLLLLKQLRGALRRWKQ